MQTIKAIITGEKSFVGKNLVKFFKKKKFITILTLILKNQLIKISLLT